MNQSKVFSLIEPVVTSLGYELVGVEFVTEHSRRCLRVLIEKEGGLTVGDCQTVSREISTLLDVEGVVQDRYDLEVSSPGLDRPLTKKADFVRFAGRVAFVHTREPINGRSNYKGLLKEVREEELLMVVDHQEFQIPLSLIERAKLVY